MSKLTTNNKLAYLGVLGTLAILAPITGDRAWLWALFMFMYARYFWVVPDELFIKNVKDAALLAFFSTTILLILYLSLISFDVDGKIPANLLWLALIVAQLVFSVRLGSLERQERKVFNADKN